MTAREEAARRFAEVMGLVVQRDEGGVFLYNPTGEDIGYVPAPDAPLHEKLAFTGRIAEAVFPNEDDVFRCGWVHGVLENCIEDARVKYDVCFAALLAGTEAKEPPHV